MCRASGGNGSPMGQPSFKSCRRTCRSHTGSWYRNSLRIFASSQVRPSGNLLCLRRRSLKTALMEAALLAGQWSSGCQAPAEGRAGNSEQHRGAKVSGILEEAIPAVLTRLARAARHAGHMPPEASNPAPIYRQLAEALEQLGIAVDATRDRSNNARSDFLILNLLSAVSLKPRRNTRN